MAKLKADELKYIKDALKYPILGIDESYTRTGLAVVQNIDSAETLLHADSLDFKHIKTKTEKRFLVKKTVRQLIEAYEPKIVICEKIRTFSQGFISKSYMSATGALIATIVDICFKYDIPVYSVDTRSWKSKVVGTSKHKTKNKKLETMEFVKAKFGFDVNNNDDMADAICIALYPLKEGAILNRET